MGVSQKTLKRLLWLVEHGAIAANGKMLELGSQNLHGFDGDTSYLSHFAADFRKRQGLPALDISPSNLVALSKGGKMGSLMELCGYGYQALDIFSDENVFLFDLNLHDLPSHFVGCFDLVTNFGTTEHVFDQVRAFRSIHDATKLGGIMYHDLPMGGYFNHGYFLYTPLFFCQLAAANDYEIIFEYYTMAGQTTLVPARMVANGHREPRCRDAAIEFAFRKTNSAPFQLPFDVADGADPKVWGDNIPYRIVDVRQSVSAGEAPFVVTRRGFSLLWTKSGRARLGKRIKALLSSTS